MKLSETEQRIIRQFCMGYAPSQVDERNALRQGTTRDLVARWWLDDKIHRGGLMETIYSGWNVNKLGYKR